MLTHWASAILEGAVSGACAWAILNAVIADGMILGVWQRALMWLASKSEAIAKPLGWCGRCFAGQVGLWAHVYNGADGIADTVAAALLSICFYEILCKING